MTRSEMLKKMTDILQKEFPGLTDIQAVLLACRLLEAIGQ